jgi:hypothetical protein
MANDSRPPGLNWPETLCFCIRGHLSFGSSMTTPSAARSPGAQLASNPLGRFNRELVRSPSFLISTFLVLANTACSRHTSTQVIAQLYREYSWEANPTSSATHSTPLIDQPVSELARFFAPELASLLIEDRECVRRSGAICRLDWDPIWDSQDPAAEDLTIRSLTANIVLVRFHHPFSGDRKLEYHLVRTRAGWRISDIRYMNGVSLLQTLRRGVQPATTA